MKLKSSTAEGAAIKSLRQSLWLSEKDCQVAIHSRALWRARARKAEADNDQAHADAIKAEKAAQAFAEQLSRVQALYDGSQKREGVLRDRLEELSIEHDKLKVQFNETERRLASAQSGSESAST